MVFPYNQKLGVKFDFYMIDISKRLSKKNVSKKEL